MANRLDKPIETLHIELSLLSDWISELSMLGKDLTDPFVSSKSTEHRGLMEGPLKPMSEPFEVGQQGRIHQFELNSTKDVVGSKPTPPYEN